MLGQLDIVQPEHAELVGQEPREVELLRRARIGADSRADWVSMRAYRRNRSSASSASSAASGDENGTLAKVGEVTIERGGGLDAER